MRCCTLTPLSMNKLIDFIIAFSLKRKYLIICLTVAAVVIGMLCFKDTPVDAFPDVTNTKVTIITQWSGRSAEEIEKFVTIPIEIAMNSVQKKTDIRSTTLFGLSVVTVVFDDHADDEYARQQVYNMINDADLPDGVRPEVQPLSGPTGEIFRYTLSSNQRNIRELKTLQDWVIERKLRSVPGIADIVSFGGEVKTFEVSVNPNQLAQYGISSLELFQAIANSNVNVGGDVIERNSQAYVVRGIGLINNIQEIGDIVVKNVNGTPILVRHLAKVHESCQPRLGQVGREDENDVVEGIVVMRKGENPEKVIAALKDKIDEIERRYALLRQQACEERARLRREFSGKEAALERAHERRLGEIGHSFSRYRLKSRRNIMRLNEQEAKEITQTVRKFDRRLHSIPFVPVRRRIMEKALFAHLEAIETPIRGRKIFLDQGLFDLSHSLMKTTDKSQDSTYVRSGFAWRIPDEATCVRFFVYWNDRGRVDLDLHASAATDSEDLSWFHVGWNSDFRSNGVCHSGDLTHSDAAEYIDVDLSSPVRYVTMNIDLYSGSRAFGDIDECYVGLMGVKYCGKDVRLYNPANCFFTHELRQDCRFLHYGYIDTRERYVRFDGIRPDDQHLRE